jgi:hypothetical protein
MHHARAVSYERSIVAIAEIERWVTAGRWPLGPCSHLRGHFFTAK